MMKYKTRCRAISMAAILLVVQMAKANQWQDSTAVEDVKQENLATDTTTNHKADAIVFRTVPDSAVHHLKEQKEFAYANDPEYWKRKPREKSEVSFLDFLFTSRAIAYLLMGLFVLLLLYVVGKILLSNNILRIRSRKKIPEANRDEELLEEADFAGLVIAAEQQGNYRLAARYRYLQLLRELDTRQLIRLNAQLTNRDYVRQMSSHPLNNKFSYLTQAYEYIWYGGFQVNASQYEALKIKFESFIR